jgi:hypothetical protein
MEIIDTELDKGVHATISKATKKDIRAIAKAKTFGFNWSMYWDPKYELFKLCVEETKEILGLMCLRDRPEPGFKFVEVVTLELRRDQIGKIKRYDRIAGCLFGFAARISIRNGYSGWLLLVAKTKTAPIFEEKYGFHYLGLIRSLAPKMASDEDNSKKLISEYLENSK